eukprot:1157302-Pelagomonas_calceolata.AAC.2
MTMNASCEGEKEEEGTQGDEELPVYHYILEVFDKSVQAAIVMQVGVNVGICISSSSVCTCPAEPPHSAFTCLSLRLQTYRFFCLPQTIAEGVPAAESQMQVRSDAFRRDLVGWSKDELYDEYGDKRERTDGGKPNRKKKTEGSYRCALKQWSNEPLLAQQLVLRLCVYILVPPAPFQDLKTALDS